MREKFKGAVLDHSGTRYRVERSSPAPQLQYSTSTIHIALSQLKVRSQIVGPVGYYSTVLLVHSRQSR